MSREVLGLRAHHGRTRPGSTAAVCVPYYVRLYLYLRIRGHALLPKKPYSRTRLYFTRNLTVYAGDATQSQRRRDSYTDTYTS